MPDKKSPISIPLGEYSPRQKAFLKAVISNSDRNYFIHGCAGSGKTILASHATRLLNDEKDVHFIVYTKLLSKYVSDMFNAHGKSIEEVDHFDEWEKEIDFKIDQNYDLIIVDECQDFKSRWIEAVKNHSKHQIWLGDASQQIYQAAKQDDGFRNINSEFYDREFDLNVNYRNSISTAQLAAAFITLNEFDTVSLEEKKNSFIKPILKNVRQTSSANNQPNVFIEAASEQDEYDCIAKIVKDIQNNSETSKHIAIVQVRHDELDRLQDELYERDVDFFRITQGKGELPNFNDKSLTLLTPIHSLKGIDMDYIIFPRTDILDSLGNNLNCWREPSINDALMHVLFSRACRRVYCSYVNKDNSYIYQTVANNLDNDFYELITCDEVLNDGMPTKSKEEVKENIDAVKEKLKDYFDDLDIE